MSELKLARLPDRKPVKIPVIVSPVLNQKLNAYAAAYKESYGEEEEVSELIPFMLEQFLDADRSFKGTRRRTGDLMSLVTTDVELVEYFFAHTVAPAFVAILVPVVVLTVLAIVHPAIALALLPFLALVALCPFLMRKRSDRLGSAAREASGEFGAVAVDCVQGLGEIVAFQQEAAMGARLDALSDRQIALRLPFFRELTLQASLLEVFTGLGGLAVVVTGAALSQAGKVDAGLLPLLTILAMAAFLPVSEIAQVGRQLADTLGATRRLYALFNEPVPVTDGPGVDDAPAAALRSGSRAAALSLESVSFSYPGQNRAALRDVSLAIPAGKTVALVGMSGAGKTTTAQLLMRFWDADRGRITLDGADLRSYRLDDLRRRIALVAQDTYLFNDSLRRNIMIARPEASEVELRAAIGHAALDDLVDALPDGLDAPVGERGTSLSGGVGRVTGTLIGALIIGVMNNGLDLMGIQSYYQQVLKGALIVGAVMLDQKRNFGA